MPAMVAALARFTDPELDGLDPDFERAWQAMPTVVETCMAGKVYHLGHTDHWNLIRQIVEDDLASAQKEPDRRRSLAQVVEVLGAVDDDLWSVAQAAVESPAFNVGLALGMYLMLDGRGGAR